MNVDEAIIVRAIRQPHGHTLYERAYWCDEAEARRRFEDDWAAEQRRCPPAWPDGARLVITATVWRPPTAAALAARPTDPTPPVVYTPEYAMYDWYGV